MAASAMQYGGKRIETSVRRLSFTSRLHHKKGTPYVVELKGQCADRVTMTLPRYLQELSVFFVLLQVSDVLQQRSVWMVDDHAAIL